MRITKKKRKFLLEKEIERALDMLLYHAGLSYRKYSIESMQNWIEAFAGFRNFHKGLGT